MYFSKKKSVLLNITFYDYICLEESHILDTERYITSTKLNGFMGFRKRKFILREFKNILHCAKL